MHTNNAPKYILLWFVGFYLRLGALIVPPLIPRLEDELGFSAGQSALATSLPMLLIAIGALLGGWLVARLGIKTTLIIGLLVMAGGSSLRSVPVSFVFFVGATVLMGLGIALMQIGLPALTRAWLPDNIGRAAAVYTTGLLAGEWIAAGFTGLLVTHFLGDAWLLSFTVWVLPVPVLVAALLLRREMRELPRVEIGRPAGPVMPDWRDPLLWRVALIMASSGTLYFSGNIFLPPILAETGRLEILDLSLSALNGLQMVTCGLLIFYADRLVGRRMPFYALNVVALATIPGLLWAPGSAVVWVAALAGAVTSTILVLALALPAWIVPQEQVSRLSAGMLAIGYTLVFLVPVVGGWLTDLTGIRALAFLPAGLLALAALASISGIRRRDHS